MSHDVALFFCQPDFPMDAWEEVIATFNPQEREVQKSKSSGNVLAEWLVTYNNASLWLELRDVRSERYVKPPKAQWEIFLSRRGHSPVDIWLQLAIPYHAMLLLEDVFFSDFQRGDYIESLTQYMELAAEVIKRVGVSKMFKLGLADSHGNPIF